MQSRRWSALWAFGGGCLTSALLIGWRVTDVDQAAVDTRVARTDGAAEVAAPRDPLPATREAAVRPPAAPVEGQAADVAATEAESGTPITDVLARLEAQYRDSAASKPAVEPPVAPQASASALPATPTTAATTSGHAAVAAIAPAAAPTPVAAPSVEAVPIAVALTAAPTRTAEAEAAAPVVALRDDVERAAADSAQQKVTDQLQRVTAMQQVALAQQTALFQQFAMLQYLQLFSQSNSRGAPPTQPPPRGVAPPRRIVDVLPPTFSATDNPWGFSNPVPIR
ncbi:MAG: hypothetical protein QM756_33395 [Polyangiaceae bacterium]